MHNLEFVIRPFPSVGVFSIAEQPTRAGGALQCVLEVSRRPRSLHDHYHRSLICVLVLPGQGRGIHVGCKNVLFTLFVKLTAILPCRLEPTDSGRHKEEVLRDLQEAHSWLIQQCHPGAPGSAAYHALQQEVSV